MHSVWVALERAKIRLNQCYLFSEIFSIEKFTLSDCVATRGMQFCKEKTLVLS